MVLFSFLVKAPARLGLSFSGTADPVSHDSAKIDGGAGLPVSEDLGALPNWLAAAGIMEAALTGKFSEDG
jgi:hypothetical protein